MLRFPPFMSESDQVVGNGYSPVIQRSSGIEVPSCSQFPWILTALLKMRCMNPVIMDGAFVAKPK